MAKWEAQYREMMESQRESLDFDYGATMEEAWRDSPFEPMTKFDDEGLPTVAPYVFGQLRYYLALRMLTGLPQSRTTNTWTRPLRGRHT